MLCNIRFQISLSALWRCWLSDRKAIGV